MKPALLFLDIDGVLNGHEQHKNLYCGLCPRCVERCNFILDATSAKIVLVSAWRYFILRGEMTLVGFNGLMQTHGLNRDSVIGYIGEEPPIAPDRGALVIKWLESNNMWKPGYAPYHTVVDDIDLGYTKHGLHYFKPNSPKGLCDITTKQFNEIMATLRGTNVASSS